MKVKIIGEARFFNDAIEIKPTGFELHSYDPRVWKRLEKDVIVSFKGENGKAYFKKQGTEIYREHVWNDQKTEPINTKLYSSDDSGSGPWLFKGYLIRVEKITSIDKADDIKLLIKHTVFKKENLYAKMKKDVERFERFEKHQPIVREQIPEDVRIYVWRRDGGKCVICRSNRNLEYDHIIPVSKGGGNTERNLQILCSDCNKKKSANI